MDLITAKIEAAARSRKEQRTIYIIVDDEGECELNNAPLKGVYTAFKNGSEIAPPSSAEANNVEPKVSTRRSRQPIKESAATPNHKEMAEVNETAATAAKPATAKKAAASTTKKPASKPAPKKAAPAKPKGKLEPIGVTMQFTPEQANKFRAKLNKVNKSAREYVAEIVLKSL